MCAITFRSLNSLHSKEFISQPHIIPRVRSCQPICIDILVLIQQTTRRNKTNIKTFLVYYTRWGYRELECDSESLHIFVEEKLCHLPQ